MGTLEHSVAGLGLVSKVLLPPCKARLLPLFEFNNLHVAAWGNGVTHLSHWPRPMESVMG